MVGVGARRCGAVLAVLAGVGWVVAVADSGPNLTELKGRSPHPLTQIFAADGSSLGYVHSDTSTTASRNRDPDAAQAGDGRDRGPALLPARRARLPGHPARRGQGHRHGRDSLQGASTLTMQLVDNMYMPAKIAASAQPQVQDHPGQARRAARAAQHARTGSSTTTSTTCPTGPSAGRPRSGSAPPPQMFFDKPVWKLNLAAAGAARRPAAGAVRSTTRSCTRRWPGKRRNEVLQAMVAAHYITPGRPPGPTASRSASREHQLHRQAPALRVRLLEQQLIKRFGAKTVAERRAEGLHDDRPERRTQAEQAIFAHEGGPGQPAAALVSIDPTTATSSRWRPRPSTVPSPETTTFDYAMAGRRQTGSAFKVFALMTLIHDYDGDPNQTLLHLQAARARDGCPPIRPTRCTPPSSPTRATSASPRRRPSPTTPCSRSLPRTSACRKVSATAHAMGITSPLTDFPSEVLGAVSVSPLRDGRRLRHARQRRRPPSATAITQGRVPRRQRREPRRPSGQPRLQRRARPTRPRRC